MIRKYFLVLFILIVLFVTLGIAQRLLAGNPIQKKQNMQAQSEKENKTSSTQANQGDAFEIDAIKNTTSLDEQVKLYTQLINRVGPERAQELLLKSGMSFDGQTHLLNHTVGDWLYGKYGVVGLSFCKDYFLSSCYHGFVIHAVARGGFEALDKVMEACYEKGPTVAVQCSHAIGHGLLTWVGYKNLSEALRDCDSVASHSLKFPLYNCHDGVFMENIWAVHENGKPSKDRWLRDSDLIYPCDDNRIDQKYIKACWSNQPMRMYQMFGGDLARVGGECLKITNREWQVTCFDGLARQIHPLTKGSVSETFRMCGLMPQGWYYPCVGSIVKSEFGVGGRELPFQICEQIDSNGKQTCYTALGEIIRAYYPQGQEKQHWCDKITQQVFRQSCKESH